MCASAYYTEAAFALLDCTCNNTPSFTLSHLCAEFGLALTKILGAHCVQLEGFSEFHSPKRPQLRIVVFPLICLNLFALKKNLG